MQVWTVTWGNTASIASGKPSAHPRPQSARRPPPRALSSFITDSQNFAPSVCSTHRPRISLRPEQLTPIARDTALLRTRPSSRTFTRTASKYTIA